MARIRSIHPAILTDEAFMTLTVEVPLAVPLLLGLWMEADDDGVFEWKPLTLKARALPAVTADIGELLQALIDNRFVMKVEIDGRQYGAIRNFKRFQRPKKPNCIYPKTEEVLAYVGNGSEPLPHEAGTGSEKSPQMEDEGGSGEGIGEGKNNKSLNCSASISHDSDKQAFPTDGSISFSKPWADIARKNGRGADVDILASAFRSFCRARDQPLDSPFIAKSFTTFCSTHRVQGTA